jgi:hypothetical protein
MNGPNKLVFVPGRPFQPSLMFTSRAGSYLSGTPPGLTLKRYTTVERHGRDKHSSLLGPFLSYEEKMRPLYNITFATHCQALPSLSGIYKQGRKQPSH